MSAKFLKTPSAKLEAKFRGLTTTCKRSPCKPKFHAIRNEGVAIGGTVARYCRDRISA